MNYTLSAAMMVSMQHILSKSSTPNHRHGSMSASSTLPVRRLRWFATKNIDTKLSLKKQLHIAISFIVSYEVNCDIDHHHHQQQLSAGTKVTSSSDVICLNGSNCSVL